MELEKLLKQREAYAGKIIKLMIQIAVIFLLPAIVGVALSMYFNLSFIYFFPGAFIVSWTVVIFLYNKVRKEMKALDARIAELRSLEEQSHKNT